MSMGYCENCEKAYTDGVWVKEIDSDTGFSESRCVCPVCGEDLTEAERCEECGEYFSYKEIEDDLCTGCRIKLQSIVKNIFLSVHSREAREYMAEYIGEV